MTATMVAVLKKILQPRSQSSKKDCAQSSEKDCDHGSSSQKKYCNQSRSLQKKTAILVAVLRQDCDHDNSSQIIFLLFWKVTSWTSMIRRYDLTCSHSHYFFHLFLLSLFCVGLTWLTWLKSCNCDGELFSDISYLKTGLVIHQKILHSLLHSCLSKRHPL